MQEWEHFTGIEVADVKDSRSVPSWINEERSYDVAAFKVNIYFIIKHFCMNIEF